MNISRWTTRCSSLLTCWCLLLMGRVVAAAEPGEIEVVIIDAADHQTNGRLLSLDFHTIRVANSKVNDFAVNRLARLEFQKPRQQKLAAAAQLFLENGDALSIEIIGMTDEFLTGVWNPPHLTKASSTRKKLKIPLEAIRAVQFPTRKNNTLQNETLASRKLRSQLLSSRNVDSLFLKNGDHLAGELQELSQDVISFQVGNQTREIALTAVAGLSMNSELISFPKLPARHWVVAFIDGSVLTITNCTWKKQTLKVTTAWGEELVLPESAVSVIHFLGGQVVHLSQLTPENYHCTTYFSSNPTWKLAINRNLFGDRLNMHGHTYLFGLGMHSQSSATFALNRKYKTFRSQIGIDKSAAGKGNVRFVIELDGKRVFTSQNITGRMEPETTPTLNVSDANQLRIIVEFGARGDIADHADWTNAILVRK